MSETPVQLRLGHNPIGIRIDISPLAIGSYRLTLELTKPFAQIYDRQEDCVAFDVGAEHFVGVVNPLRQDWQVGSILFAAALKTSPPSGTIATDTDEFIDTGT